MKTASNLHPHWRRRRDSNPRYPFEVYTLSRRAPSTARTLLLYLIPSETTRPQAISSERRGNVRIFSEFFPFSLRKIVFLTFIRPYGRLLLNPDSKNPTGISGRPFNYLFRLYTVQLGNPVANQPQTAALVTLSPIWNRRQIRRIGLQHQIIERHRAQKIRYR